MSAVPATHAALHVLSQPQLAVSNSDNVDLIEVLEAVRVLIRLEARPIVIQDITGASQALIRNQMEFEGAGVGDKGGRRPRSLTAVIETVDLHLEASIFLRQYLKLIEIYKHKCDWGSELVAISEMDLSGTLVRGAFIRALMLTRSLCPSRRVTVDHARLIALAHSSGDVSLVKCEICPTHFMRAESVQANRSWTRGDCPVCRKIASIGRPRAPARITNRAQARQLYARISGAGVTLAPAENVQPATA